LVADPRDRDTLFAACIRELFKTVDGGQRWQLIDEHADVPVIAPSDPRVVYQPFQEMVSRDGGRHWTVNRRQDGEWTRVPTVQVDPTDPERLVAAGDAGVEHSRDGGLHWSTLNSGLDAERGAQAIAIAPMNHAVMVVRTWDATYRTDNGGAHWTPIGSPLPSFNVTEVRFDGASVDVLTVLNQDELLRSVDGGDHWGSLSATLGREVAAWATHPSNADVVVAGTDRGIFVTQDGGASWTPAVAGIRRAVVTVSLDDGVHPTLYAYVGKDLLASEDEGRTWVTAPGPEPSDSTPQGSLRGRHARALERLTPISGGVATSVVASARRPEQLFAAISGLLMPPRIWRSDDAGTGWSPVRTCTDYWPSSCVVKIDPQDADVVYALSYVMIDGGADVALSTDAGTTWSKVEGIGSVHVLTLAATRPTTVLAWATGDGGLRLHRSIDRGAHWTEAGAGLPDTIVTSIVSMPSDPAHLFAGTRGHGMFHSRDAGSTWQPVR
jgi:photosystem II stability/assembly factor-like uncharacterized protein